MNVAMELCSINTGYMLLWKHDAEIVSGKTNMYICKKQSCSVIVILIQVSVKFLFVSQ